MIDLTSAKPRVKAQNGEIFTISPDLWGRNQQQQSLLLRYFALPLKEENNRLWLGVDSLSNLSACETIAFITGKLVEPVLLESTQLKELLQQLAPNQLQVEEQVKYYQHQEQSHLEQQDDEPVIRLLNQIFESALQNNASDIHLETLADHFQVRFRIDGVLQAQPPLSKNLANRIISRLKLIAKLDISETRLPQDGRFQFKTTFSDILDFRLSTLPTHWGEKVVLRAQQNKPVELSFSELGMTENQQKEFQRALSQPQGLILVTGPTGSGKSILMRSIMSILPNNIFDKNDKFFFDGKEVKKGEKLPISMIFQNPMTSLDPVRTIGFHLIEVIERFQNKSKEEAKKLAIEQLEKVGILNAPLRMEQYPHELSGGMRQRILIAMALLANPKLLVADEPTTALDVTVQAQILSLIKKLQKETELSVALVSHDFGVIAGMCDYVYIMYRGRVVEKGNVEEIFSNAQHPYTKQLLAAARLENTNNELLTVDYKEDDKHYTWQKLSDTHEYLKEVE